MTLACGAAWPYCGFAHAGFDFCQFIERQAAPYAGGRCSIPLEGPVAYLCWFSQGGLPSSCSKHDILTLRQFQGEGICQNSIASRRTRPSWAESHAYAGCALRLA
jgi:hypothetical protein